MLLLYIINSSTTFQTECLDRALQVKPVSILFYLYGASARLIKINTKYNQSKLNEYITRLHSALWLSELASWFSSNSFSTYYSIAHHSLSACVYVRVFTCFDHFISSRPFKAQIANWLDDCFDGLHRLFDGFLNLRCPDISIWWWSNGKSLARRPHCVIAFSIK